MAELLHDKPVATVHDYLGDKEDGITYHLGQAMLPTSEVSPGAIMRALRVWAALDLLLTCGAISEARAKTKDRLAAVSEL